MTEIKVLSNTQRITVNPAASSITIINAGPPGPKQGTHVSNDAPVSASAGDLWYDTDDSYILPVRASVLPFPGYDDLGMPLFPELWVKVMQVYAAHWQVSNWIIDGLVGTVDADGANYTLVGQFVGEPDIRGSLFEMRKTAFLAQAQTTSFSTIGPSISSLTGTPTEILGAQNLPAAVRLTSTTTNGLQSSKQLVCVGSTLETINSGFRFTTTIKLTDASYNETGSASTGTRIGLGLSSAGSISTVLASDSLANEWIGFIRRSVNGSTIDTNWRLGSRRTSLQTLDTGVPFVIGHLMTFDFAVAPGGSRVMWMIKNHTTGTKTSGVWTPDTGFMPNAATMLSAFVGIRSTNAVARTIDISQVKVVA